MPWQTFGLGLNFNCCGERNSRIPTTSGVQQTSWSSPIVARAYDKRWRCITGTRSRDCKLMGASTARFPKNIFMTLRRCRQKLTQVSWVTDIRDTFWIAFSRSRKIISWPFQKAHISLLRREARVILKMPISTNTRDNLLSRTRQKHSLTPWARRRRSLLRRLQNGSRRPRRRCPRAHRTEGSRHHLRLSASQEDASNVCSLIESLRATELAMFQGNNTSA